MRTQNRSGAIRTMAMVAAVALTTVACSGKWDERVETASTTTTPTTAPDSTKPGSTTPGSTVPGSTAPGPKNPTDELRDSLGRLFDDIGTVKIPGEAQSCVLTTFNKNATEAQRSAALGWPAKRQATGDQIPADVQAFLTPIMAPLSAAFTTCADFSDLVRGVFAGNLKEDEIDKLAGCLEREAAVTESEEPAFWEAVLRRTEFPGALQERVTKADTTCKTPERPT